ncbi:MAG: HAMP domain-containing sensor histidine kinase [Candidatus Staskawiczbacteria bacterium]|nr:HAMP domain-containing sensor histidine kinase [Candidatus Staskawiczbacteria bacterium]
MESRYFYSFITNAIAYLLVAVLLSAVFVSLIFMGAWFYNTMGFLGIIIISFVFSVLVVFASSTLFRRMRNLGRMKGDFISLAAHQLRTPSAGIKWSIKSLMNGEEGELTKKQLDFLQKIYDTNERMINLVSNLLDANKIEAGEYLSNLKYSHIENSVDFVVKQLEEKADRKKVKIIVEKPGEKLPALTLDEDKIRIVIDNLVDNAINYTPEGGEIKISMLKNGNEEEIKVTDTGRGIPKSDQSKIFSKFFRGSNILKVNKEGTGMGLFMSKNIINLHGGKIWFTSEEGKGTTFSFTIPIPKKTVI